MTAVKVLLRMTAVKVLLRMTGVKVLLRMTAYPEMRVSFDFALRAPLRMTA